ncbi:MAG: hypothetical protein WCT17_05340 [Bacilli bacterium]
MNPLKKKESFVQNHKRKEKLQALEKKLKYYTHHVDEGMIDLKIVSGAYSRGRTLDIIQRLLLEANYIPANVNLTLMLTFEEKDNISDQITQFKQAIQGEIIKMIHHENQEIKQVNLISFVLLLVGLLSLGVSIFIRESDIFVFAIQQIFTIVSWVCIWEAIDKFIFEKRKLTIGKINLLQLYFANYELKNENQDN